MGLQRLHEADGLGDRFGACCRRFDRADAAIIAEAALDLRGQLRIDFLATELGRRQQAGRSYRGAQKPGIISVGLDAEELCSVTCAQPHAERRYDIFRSPCRKSRGDEQRPFRPIGESFRSAESQRLHPECGARLREMFLFFGDEEALGERRARAEPFERFLEDSAVRFVFACVRRERDPLLDRLKKLAEPESHE